MNFILRGDICRNCSMNIQLIAYKSIVKHVIKPFLISKPEIKNKEINIIVVSYNDNYNNDIKNIFNDYNFYYFKIIRKNQVDGWINSLNILKTHNFLEKKIGVMILRSDLVFKQNIDYTRISKNKILTQWNLFHQKTTGEVADQIQFIGDNLINDFLDKINKIRIDTKWPGTLHNFYNYCVKYFGKENISYLNYITNPTPNNDRCEIRGNPRGRFKPHYSYKNELGNPLYNYTRFEK